MVGSVLHVVVLRHLDNAPPRLGSSINTLIRLEHAVNLLSVPTIVIQGSCRDHSYN